MRSTPKAAFRGLLFAACLGPAAAQAVEPCGLVPAAAPDNPIYVEAVVVGPASDAEVLSQTRIAIERTHAPESPAYANLPRIDAIFVDAGGGQHRTIAAVIGAPTPAHGAHVTLASRHRDPNAPCAFIPWTVAPKGSGT
jgi:hypothetical protein